jgi:uncharacterized protein
VLRLIHGRLLQSCGRETIEASKYDADSYWDQRDCKPNMNFVVLLLGLVVGVLVGLLGIGGGTVLVPALVYFLRMDQHMAQGTSLFILLPPVGLGALREYWKQGQVDLHAGILCAGGMLVGTYGGSLIAIPMGSRDLKGMFGFFLMLTAILLLRKQPSTRSTDTAEELKGKSRG